MYRKLYHLGNVNKVRCQSQQLTDIDTMAYFVHSFLPSQKYDVKGRQIIAELQSIRLKRLNCGSSKEQEK